VTYRPEVPDHVVTVSATDDRGEGKGIPDEEHDAEEPGQQPPGG
jgi:hypothetical protein